MYHKVFGRTRDLFQFHRDSMMISFIVILSFVGRAISSLSVQGSLSTLNDDTVSIDLFANESNDSVDELVRKLHETKRIHLTVDLGGKIINIQQALLEINDRINRYQNYFVMNFNKMTTSINVAEPKMKSPMMNNASLGKSDSANANVGEIMLRKIFCKILHNDDFLRNIISRTCSINLISIDEENKSSIDRSQSKTRSKHDDTAIGDQIASKMKTSILHHSTLTTDIGGDKSNENSTASEINPVGQENGSTTITSNLIDKNFAYQMSRDKNLLVVETASITQRTISKQKNFNKRIFSDNSFTTKFNDLESRFRLSKDILALSADEKATTGAKRTESLMDRMLPISSQENVTDIPRIFSRRAFQTRVPWSKEDKNAQYQPHVSRIKMDKISTMDEILEAVHQVLPTEEPATLSSEESKLISVVS